MAKVGAEVKSMVEVKDYSFFLSLLLLPMNLCRTNEEPKDIRYSKGVVVGGVGGSGGGTLLSSPYHYYY